MMGTDLPARCIIRARSGYSVTKVSVIDGKLVIEIQGWAKLWSLTSVLEIPLEHVMDVRPADDHVGGIRALGTHVPGVITAGAFVQEGSWVFWNVHNPANAIAIDLRDERYSKLIVEVADPAETIDALQHAL
jgi:hypothetical protein